MLLDSEKTSYMTLFKEKVTNQRKCKVDIALRNDSTVTASSTCTRVVKWNGAYITCTISLSNTLFSPELSMSLLSVPALVQKGVSVLFVPGKALMVDTDNEFTIIGKSRQGTDGLYCISSKLDGASQGGREKLSHAESAMVALARANIVGPKQPQPEDSDDKGTGDEDSEFDEREDAEEKGGDHEQAGMTATKKNEPRQQSFCSTNSAKLWHLRLGHAAPMKLIRRELKSGGLHKPSCTHTDCITGAKGKFRRSYKGSLTGATRIGTLHADTKGQVEEASTDGHR